MNNQSHRALIEKAEVFDDGSKNPLIQISPAMILEWLRGIADDAGYADREERAVQISFEQDGKPVHLLTVPTIVYMVSGIPNTRALAASPIVQEE